MDAAGLVLGVIPMAIQALETYRNILSAMKNARRDLEHLIRDLKTEQQILQNTCETLLGGIVPDSVLDDMIEDPFGPAWNKYNDEVRLRLWRSADIFQERIMEMKEAAMELQKKLAIDQNGKTNLSDRRSVLHELQSKTYFTLKKKDYNEILSRLKAGNAVLNTLSNQNSELEPTRRSRSQAKLARLIRKLSQGIYGALQSVMTCSGAHNVGLEMAPRKDVILPGEEEEETARALHFGVIIESHDQQRSRRWEAVRIQLVQDKDALPTPPTTPSSDVASSKSRLRVRWAPSLTIRSSSQITDLTSHKTTFNASSSTLSSELSNTSFSQSLPITDLCQILQGGKGKATVPNCYGYISSKSRKFNLYHHKSQPENLSAMTLRTILDSSLDSGVNHFIYAERLKVALALSYSILHLYNTPWLAKIVTPDDILFIREQGQASGSSTHQLGRPFLAKVLSPASGGTFQSQPSEPAMFRPMDLTILSLGLLLIQIIVGRPIAELAIDPKMKVMDAILSKQAIASQMTGSVLENGGINYAGVVQWCLNRSVACLDDEKLGQEFHEAVIVRLEDDLRLQTTVTL